MSNDNVGTATPAETIKTLWHKACFKRVPVKSETNPNKHAWRRTSAYVPLKVFTRSLIKDGNEVAVKFLSNKEGTLNEKKSETNAMRARASGQASKLSRKSKKSSSKKPTDMV